MTVNIISPSAAAVKAAVIPVSDAKASLRRKLPRAESLRAGAPHTRTETRF